MKERVYGGWGVALLYANRWVARLQPRAIQRVLSRIYGWFQRRRVSRFKIPGFVRKYRIAMAEFEPTLFRSFDDFFTRRFRKGARTFPSDPADFGAIAEARYLAVEQTEPTTFLPIKGASLQVFGILGSLAETYSSRFVGGAALVARLAPVDYHRFHFPDSGRILARVREHGPLHSVNPRALQAKGDILFTNERDITVLETENFGLIGMVEVGALMVGTIEQTFSGTRFERGQEKGMFHFGGSTVVILGQPGAWKPSQDLLERSRRGVESLVRLGEPIGRKNSS